MNFLDEMLKRGEGTADAADTARNSDEDSGYKAYQLAKRPETLELRLSDDDGEIFDYMMIRPVSYRLSKMPQRITVYTTAGRILIKGRNLRDLKDGFTRRAVAYVREYDTERDGPLDEATPCIDSIDFVPVDGKKPEEGARKTRAANANEPA